MDYPTREEIRSICTEQAYQSGITYYQDGRILELSIEEGTVSAAVHGTYEYDVTIEFEGDIFHTNCTCPYDFAGDCKHIVAVLLALAENEKSNGGDRAVGDGTTNSDFQTRIEQAPAGELRSFLLDVLQEDAILRERFIAYTGGESARTITEYKEEIEAILDDAASNRGLIEANTYVDFSKYYELASTHRSHGNRESAATIYRALAESIRENLGQIDDSSGHYGSELGYAIEQYAETVRELDPHVEKRREQIEYLFSGFIEAEYSFVRESYDSALRRVCTNRTALTHLLSRLERHIPDEYRVSSTQFPDHREETPPETHSDTAPLTTREPPPNQSKHPEQLGLSAREAGDVLQLSDFTGGPLAVEEFTGGTIESKFLLEGPLDFDPFVGGAFTSITEEPTTAVSESESNERDRSGSEIIDSRRIWDYIRTYRYILSELQRHEELRSLYGKIYLEETEFCREYSRLLYRLGDEKRALEVLEDGITTFGTATDLQWMAAKLYRGRDERRFRETLQELFVTHADWDAYDELKSACTGGEWVEVSEEIVRELQNREPRRLLDVYIRENALDEALSLILEHDSLAWYREYRSDVGHVEPTRYFEAYSDLLLETLATDPDSLQYSNVPSHLRQLEELVSTDRFESLRENLYSEFGDNSALVEELKAAGF